jgi:hypothetical protein
MFNIINMFNIIKYKIKNESPFTDFESKNG